MDRDMDTIRTIVLAVADAPTSPVSSAPGISDAAFAMHAQWLHEAGLIHAALSAKDSMQPANKAIIWRLTWAGCDFAAAIRSDTLWKKAKTEVIKPSASWTFGVLMDWLKGQITEQFGNLAA